MYENGVLRDEGEALHRFMADRAGAKGVREVPGGSHALSVSQPDAVTASILDAAEAVAA